MKRLVALLLILIPSLCYSQELARVSPMHLGGGVAAAGGSETHYVGYQANRTDGVEEAYGGSASSYSDDSTVCRKWTASEGGTGLRIRGYVGSYSANSDVWGVAFYIGEQLRGTGTFTPVQ